MKSIVAVDKNWGIGCEGDMLVSLKRDMSFFIKMTTGKTIILGRKTLESFPNGKPLKNRTHIVFSREMNEQDGITVVNDIAALKKLEFDFSDAYVVGGEAIYRLMLPYCDTAYITKINQGFIADTYYPNLDEMDNWTQAEIIDSFSENGVNAEIIRYINADVQPL